MYRAREICRSAVSLFMPNRCPFCDRLVGATEYWCEDCYNKLPFIEESSELPEHIDGIMSCCRYKGRARSAVLRMKKGSYIYAPEAFAVLMTELVGDIIQNVDIVTAVPCSFWRGVQLGYRHAERIAKDIAFRSNKPYKRLAKVSGKKLEQKKLNREERLENARNSYKIGDNKYILGKNILIVDDVCTTGATLSVIAGQLKMAGAVKVYAVTFARV